MHHLVHIESATLQPARRLQAASIKPVDSGKFGATLGAIILAVPASKSNGQLQTADDRSATSNNTFTRPVATLSSDATEVKHGSLNPGDIAEPEPESVTTVLADAKGSTIEPKLAAPVEGTGTPSLQSSVGLDIQKKPAHKDAAKVVNTSEDQMTDTSAQAAVPVPSANAVTPPPVQLVALISTEVGMPKLEKTTASTDVKPKAVPNRPSVTAPRSSIHDTRKPEAAAAPSLPDAKQDVSSQVATILPQASMHEVVHAGTAIAPQEVAGVQVSASHSSLQSVTSPTAKAVDMGIGHAASEAGPQASDMKTLVATPNVLEVGIASGSHGWLRVRAELGQTGEVAASVVAASVGAAEGLHKELPAISAYLAGERVGVSSLVVNASEKSAGAQDSALNNGGAGATGSHAGANDRGRDVHSGVASSSRPRDDSSGTVDDIGMAVAAMSAPIAMPINGSGGWLSVRV